MSRVTLAERPSPEDIQDTLVEQDPSIIDRMRDNAAALGAAAAFTLLALVGPSCASGESESPNPRKGPESVEAVALGDSYTSNPAAGDASEYVDPECKQQPLAAHRVALNELSDETGIPHTLEDGSCNAAMAGDIADQIEKLNLTEKERYNVDYITLTIIGNDLGFRDIVIACGITLDGVECNRLLRLAELRIPTDLNDNSSDIENTMFDVLMMIGDMFPNPDTKVEIFGYIPPLEDQDPENVPAEHKLACPGCNKDGVVMPGVEIPGGVLRVNHAQQNAVDETNCVEQGGSKVDCAEQNAVDRANRLQNGRFRFTPQFTEDGKGIGNKRGVWTDEPFIEDHIETTLTPDQLYHPGEAANVKIGKHRALTSESLREAFGLAA